MNFKKIPQTRPVKSDQQIKSSSMAEDDPHVSCVPDEDVKDSQRWGRNHKGAKILKNLYSRGKVT
jgi:hypothetical protein